MSMLTDSPPIARCSRTRKVLRCFMVLNAVAWFFSLPKLMGSLFPTRRSPAWCFGSLSSRVLARTCTKLRPELPAELLIENLDLAVQARSTFGWAEFPSNASSMMSCRTPSSMNDAKPAGRSPEPLHATGGQLHHRRRSSSNLESRVLQSRQRALQHQAARDQPKPQRIHRTRHGHLHRLIDLADACRSVGVLLGPRAWPIGTTNGATTLG